MRADLKRKLLISVLTCICVLFMDAGSCLCVLADPVATGGDETVIGSSVVVGGKAVAFVNPESMQSQTESAQVSETEVSSEESSDDFKPTFQQIRDNRIVDAAFYKKTSLTRYEFPEQEITAIGDFAFARSGLNEMMIPDTVTKIGYGAFYHCDQLTEVVIPESVKEIEPYAFEKSAWVEQWRAAQKEAVAQGRDAFLVVGDGILIAYEGNKKKVTIPVTVKKIAGSVFQDHTNITSVILPATLTEVGECAFENCSSLTSISGGKNLEVIRDKAFAGCPITEIQIAETVKEIGMDAFDLADTQTAAGTAVVVFQGSKLPSTGYTNRATRLSNTTYREHSFEGVPIAVVRKEVSDLTDTVLDADLYGFSGIICRMESNKASEKEGVLTIIQVNGRVDSYPESIVISGRDYQIQDPSGYVAKSVEWPLNGGLTVKCNADSLKPQNLVTAQLNGLSTAYELSVGESSAVKELMEKAYEDTFGTQNSGQFYCYSLNLTDLRAGVPIYKLGDQNLIMTIPLPVGCDSENLRVGILDDNGFLKEIPVVCSPKQDVICAAFQMDRISAFVLY